jgi:hypothetical protein
MYKKMLQSLNGSPDMDENTVKLKLRVCTLTSVIFQIWSMYLCVYSELKVLE